MIPLSTFNKTSFRSSACDCLVMIFVIITLAFLIAALPAVLRLLILVQPAAPVFSTSSSSISVSNVSDSNMATADRKLVVSVRNPNKKSITYHQIAASSSSLLGNNSITLRSFVQLGKSTRNLQVYFTKFSLQFPNCSTDTSCGTFNLTLEMDLMAEYEGWICPLRTDSIKVLCYQTLNTRTMNFDSMNTICDADSRWHSWVTKWNTFFWRYIFVLAVFLGILCVSL